MYCETLFHDYLSVVLHRVLELWVLYYMYDWLIFGVLSSVVLSSSCLKQCFF